MANHGAERETFTGRVIKANDTGVIIDTMPDVWLNRSSKGNAASLELPQVGQRVSIEATPWKDRYYIGSVMVYHNGHTPANGNGKAAEGHQDAQDMAQEPDKDRRISRLAVLNTAVALLSHNVPVGERIKAEDVLHLAETLEAWTYRPTPE